MQKLSIFLCLLLLTGCATSETEISEPVDKPRMFPNNYRQTVKGSSGVAIQEHYRDYDYMEIRIADDTFLKCAFIDDYLLIHSKYESTEHKVYVKDCPNICSDLLYNSPEILENAVRVSPTEFSSVITGGENTRLLYIGGALVTKNIGDTIDDVDGNVVKVTEDMGVSSAQYSIQVDKNNCITSISCEALGLYTEFEQIPYEDLDRDSFSAITSVSIDDFLYLLSIYDSAMNMEE